MDRLAYIGSRAIGALEYEPLPSSSRPQFVGLYLRLNILTHNKDDHAKNFAFIRRAHGWELSPAFDLTFSSGLNNQHTTDIAGSGNPRLKDIQRVAANCGIKRWREMLEQVRSVTRQWQVIAAQEGVSGEERQTIDNALAEIDGRLG